jgi:hypothetical protein
LSLIADNSKRWKKRKRDDEDYPYAEEEMVDGGDGGKLLCRLLHAPCGLYSLPTDSIVQ